MMRKNDTKVLNIINTSIYSAHNDVLFYTAYQNGTVN